MGSTLALAAWLWGLPWLWLLTDRGLPWLWLHPLGFIACPWELLWPWLHAIGLGNMLVGTALALATCPGLGSMPMRGCLGLDSMPMRFASALATTCP